MHKYFKLINWNKPISTIIPDFYPSHSLKVTLLTQGQDTVLVQAVYLPQWICSSSKQYSSSQNHSWGGHIISQSWSYSLALSHSISECLNLRLLSTLELTSCTRGDSRQWLKSWSLSHHVEDQGWFTDINHGWRKCLENEPRDAKAVYLWCSVFIFSNIINKDFWNS